MSYIYTVGIQKKFRRHLNLRLNVLMMEQRSPLDYKPKVRAKEDQVEPL